MTFAERVAEKRAKIEYDYYKERAETREGDLVIFYTKTSYYNPLDKEWYGSILFRCKNCDKEVSVSYRTLVDKDRAIIKCKGCSAEKIITPYFDEISLIQYQMDKEIV